MFVDINLELQFETKSTTAFVIAESSCNSARWRNAGYCRDRRKGVAAKRKRPQTGLGVWPI
jgi:hypothetical protein